MPPERNMSSTKQITLWCIIITLALAVSWARKIYFRWQKYFSPVSLSQFHSSRSRFARINVTKDAFSFDIFNFSWKKGPKFHEWLPFILKCHPSFLINCVAFWHWLTLRVNFCFCVVRTISIVYNFHILIISTLYISSIQFLFVIGNNL